MKPAEQAGTQAAPPPAAEGTSNLPELVVNDEEKKKKKTEKAKQVPSTAPVYSNAEAEAAAPPPGVTLGTTAPSDTGTTSFDNSNVRMRTNGSGDANTFMRNLPNVQYQNQAGSESGGATATKTVDTRPEEISISGGRTYENNIMINGVSTTNITGPVESSGGVGGLDQWQDLTYGQTFGVSAQNVFVPTEFVGEATVIDSNASAEYGQFLGGVVMYDLVGPPTDRYRATVSYSRETSDWANYLLADPFTSSTLQPPTYTKNNLAASVGAPLTNDFSFILQASRQEAESSKPKEVQLVDRVANENSDNIFLRFAATARTDIGKFTFDTSYTDYFQRWESARASNYFIDMTTESTSTQLKYDTELAGVRLDAIGLGGVKLLARAYYNDSVSEHNSGGNRLVTRAAQVLRYNAAANTWSEVWRLNEFQDWCRPVDADTYSNPLLGFTTNASAGLTCQQGGIGSSMQSQTDFGALANVSGKVLLGSFKTGLELKQYEGRHGRPEDVIVTSGYGSLANGTYYQTVGATPGVTGNRNPVMHPSGTFICPQGPDAGPDGATPDWCRDNAYISSYTLYPTFESAKTLNALHTFAELDQTWEWLNLRGGLRLDYEDYFKDINIAPRTAATVTPFEGLSLTGGYNRYYQGETLYYAIRAATPQGRYRTRAFVNYDAQKGTGGGPGPFGADPNQVTNVYTAGEAMRTPYDDEYTGTLAIRDPLFGGQIRLRYVERYGRDQFSTTACGNNCTVTGNLGKDYYESESAEYFKAWNKLDTPFGLNAAAISASITQSTQKSTQNNYLLNADLNGDGVEDRRIAYRRASYDVKEFQALTGNLDIPIRIGSTLSTVWMDGFLELNVSAGINLGFEGVATTGSLVGETGSNGVPGCSQTCTLYTDKTFGATLKLDVSGQINVTEQASIQFHVDNVTDSKQNTVGTIGAPYTLGRSMWLGSSLKF